MFEQPAFFRKHEINEVKRFIEQQDNAFGCGSTTILSHNESPTPCHGCQELIDLGSTCIYIKRADDTSLWHPQCFICTQCKKVLAKLMYFYKDGQLYCDRHHGELYKPRYNAYDDIVFHFESTEAHCWNMLPFFCHNCQEPLDGERYIMRKSQSFCLNCFETMYPEHCDTCCEPIEADQAQITYESHQWHATETCFCCYACLIPLNNSDFLQDYGALFCSNECASQINNHPINTELILQNIFHEDPDIIPTSYIHTKILRACPKNLNPQQPTISHRRIKDYLSNDTDNRNYQPTVFVQDQTSPDSIYSKEQKLNITKNRLREPIQIDNDFNLEQVDRHGVTLEVARHSTSISSSASLPYLSHKSFPKPKIKNSSRISQHTLIDRAPSNRLKSCHSTGIMSVISCPKSMITSLFLRASLINGSSRFTKQYRVPFVNDEKEKNSKYSPTMNYKSKSLCRSSSVDDDNQEDFNSIYDQFDIYGNRLRKPINCRTKISYVNETSTINPKLMKKTTTLNKKQKKSNEGRRKKDCIISLPFFCILPKSLH